jgi:hypothetical protein
MGVGPICARMPKIPCIFPNLAVNLGFRDEFAHERAKGTAITAPVWIELVDAKVKSRPAQSATPEIGRRASELGTT